jgi:hypothetical protein
MPENSGDNNTVDGETPNPSSPKQEINTSTNPVKGDNNGQVKMAMAISSAKSLATQGINAAVSTIGLSTGNYYAQRQAERVISGTQTLVGLAMAASNPVTLAVSIAGMAISKGAELWAQNKERELSNFEASQNAVRLGYSNGRR